MYKAKWKTYSIGFVVLFFLLFACNPTAQDIEYGADGCHFCSMTIVDKQHAAQLVTQKGKVFKFDAAECMLNYLKEVDDTKIALFLTNTYYQPGELIDATMATYLISKELPSPMGEFLTAFETREKAEMARLENQGDLYTWSELRAKFK